MYVCGVTVYDYIHLGHARAYIAFDIIKRYLKYKGYQVTHIQNFTDIDDKIIKRANEQNITTQELTDKFIEAFFQDIDQLNVERATSYPTATGSIDKIIEMIQKIIDNGFGYEVDGDVYYSVRNFKEYGKLSKRDFAENEAGARIEINKKKQDPFDFGLWKKAKDNEPAWDSPWGKGRPGWHIECSAMSLDCLGLEFDIHGGGNDLIFPHHENEIAQSEAVCNKNHVKYWLHNGFVNINNEKMSKSLGNFFSLRDILKNYSGEVVRLFMLGTHYRAPINFEDSLLDDSKKNWQKLYDTVHRSGLIELEDDKELEQFKDKFEEAMDDDFNAAEALGHVFNLVKYCNRTNSQKAVTMLKKLLAILGIELSAQITEIPTEITVLAKQRDEARAAKNYKLSDQLREKLTAKGYEVKDTPKGTEVRKI